MHNGIIDIIVECCVDGEYAGTYKLTNGLHYRERFLTLIESTVKESYVDVLKRARARVSEEKEDKKDKGVNIDMRKVSDIRVGSKLVTIPQKNAAPQKVECKTVVMTVDGKDYEAVCMPGDTFDVKTGIEVALIKSIFGGMTQYEKYIRDLVKFYNTCENKRKEDKRIAAKREKDIARKNARKEKKANAERQARVDEMAEAFLKAMRDYDGIGMDSMIDEDTTQVVNINVEQMCKDFLASKGLVAVPSNSEDCVE